MEAAKKRVIHGPRLALIGCAMLATWGLLSAARAQDEEPMKDTTSSPAATPAERADVPVPRTVEEPWMSLAEWRRRFEAEMHDPNRSEARLVMLGDSITEAWCPSPSFQSRFGKYHPLNLGIGGDQTQHVLWRIQQGVLDGLHPELLVLMVGINNLGNGFTPEETVDGVRAATAAVHRHLPKTPILVLSILPSGQEPDDPLRAKIRAANEGIAALAQPNEVDVEDVGSVFPEADGSISPAIMEDFLHPTEAGQQRLTDAVAPLIERFLKPGLTRATQAEAPRGDTQAP